MKKGYLLCPGFDPSKTDDVHPHVEMCRNYFKYGVIPRFPRVINQLFNERLLRKQIDRTGDCETCPSRVAS